MNAKELIDALAKKLGTSSQRALATALGVTQATLNNWKNRDEDLSPLQVASALAKSQHAAIQKSQLEMIKPIVELYPIDPCLSKMEAGYLVFDGRNEATSYARGLRDELSNSYGIYIFYDSRGSALYVGKAREQSLWKEMNLAFNRPREVQTIGLVAHPRSNKDFQPGYEKLRKIKDTQLELCGLACYFSAYDVDDGVIEDLEALMVRGFANNLLNVRMETFAHTRS